MDYLVKNGAPRVVQDIKDELYKIREFHNFSYNDNGQERGVGGKKVRINTRVVRDKSKELYELLSDPTALHREREFARQTREKLGNSSSS